MPCCKAEEYRGWCGKEDTVHTDESGDDFCVFHAPQGKKGITVEEFNKLVFKRIDDYKKINETYPYPLEYKNENPCNLSGTIFEGDIDFNVYNEKKPLPPIDFIGAKFSGATDFYRSHFEGETYFSEAEFVGDAFFYESKFNGGVYFRDTKFVETADFGEADFRGEAYFRKAIFCKSANFTDSKFHLDANFMRSEFKGESRFDGVSFDGKAYFSMVKFGGEAYFFHTEFAAIADFSGNIFKWKAVFDHCSFNEKADFRFATFIELCLFRDSIFQKLADFKNLKITKSILFKQAAFEGIADFRGAEIRNAVFVNTDFKDRALFNYAKFDYCFFRESFFFDLALFLNITVNKFAGFYETIFMEPAYFSQHGNNSIFGDRLSMRSCDFQEPARVEGANLEKASFINTDLRDIRFVDCKWPEVKEGGFNRRAIYDEIKGKPPETVETLYRQMKQKCKNDHNEPEASIWHFNEKETWRRRLEWKSNFWEKLLLTAYACTSGYAERPVRAAIALISIISVSTLMLLFLFKEGSGKCISDGVLSILQYATLDRHPVIKPKEPITKYFKLFVQIIIYLQVTFFALAVRNRFRR